MKKILLTILVLFGLKTQAQVNYCDSVSYTTYGAPWLGNPLILSGFFTDSSVDTMYWTWTVCTSNACYSNDSAVAYFPQVSISDTLKVCYDFTAIYNNNLTFNCTDCDTLVWNNTFGFWEKLISQPLNIMELELNSVKDNKMYDLLGREIFEAPIGEMYIKNNKKCIRIK